MMAQKMCENTGFLDITDIEKIGTDLNIFYTKKELKAA